MITTETVGLQPQVCLTAHVHIAAAVHIFMERTTAEPVISYRARVNKLNCGMKSN